MLRSVSDIAGRLAGYRVSFEARRTCATSAAVALLLVSSTFGDRAPLNRAVTGAPAAALAADGPAPAQTQDPARQADDRTAAAAATEQAALDPAPAANSHPDKLAALPLGGIEELKLPPSRPQTETRTVSIGRGDTLVKAMERAGAGRRQAHLAATAMADVFDPRRLKPGHDLVLTFTRTGDGGSPSLKSVRFDENVAREIVAHADGAGGYKAEGIDRPLTTHPVRAAGTIDDSLYLSARAAGLPPAIIIEMIRLYSFIVDFQRDIQPGDRFEVFYESQHTEDGTLARLGDIRYANLHVGGKDLPLYRHTLKDGTVDYFDPKGSSARKSLMRTPIDGARLSSRFGKRRHPILGYTRMHKGVDFAAPRGTPIMAAGDGVVEYAGRHGGYGKYVRIRHNNDYRTAYAHMSGYGRGIRKGRRVKQGQTIGYVGSTGRSTGPHLHYEVLRGGRQVNPLKIKVATGLKLKGKELARFEEVRAHIDTLAAAAPPPADRKVAAAD